MQHELLMGLASSVPFEPTYTFIRRENILGHRNYETVDICLGCEQDSTGDNRRNVTAVKERSGLVIRRVLPTDQFTVFRLLTWDRQIQT